MALPNIKESDILNALIFIGKHGVPDKNKSTTYELIKDGKTYPPKYVIAVADHLANGTDTQVSRSIESIETHSSMQSTNQLIILVIKTIYKYLHICTDSMLSKGFTSIQSQEYLRICVYG